jgi:hypothetical protein
LGNAFTGNIDGLLSSVNTNIEYGTKIRYELNKKERFEGQPGEVVVTLQSGNRDVFLTKIGSGGKAVSERHLTDHKRPSTHSNPHDHAIKDVIGGIPTYGVQTNYLDVEPPKLQEEGVLWTASLNLSKSLSIA